MSQLASHSSSQGSTVGKRRLVSSRTCGKAFAQLVLLLVDSFFEGASAALVIRGWIGGSVSGAHTLSGRFRPLEQQTERLASDSLWKTHSARSWQAMASDSGSTQTSRLTAGAKRSSLLNLCTACGTGSLWALRVLVGCTRQDSLALGTLDG